MSHRTRLVSCAAVGFTSGLAARPLVSSNEFAILLGWAATSLVFLVWTWSTIFGLDDAATAKHSVQEDETRAETGVLLVTASLMSLVGVGFGLLRASKMEGLRQFLLTILCVVAIGLSWSVVHTVFTLRYAHEYFAEKGGIDFGPEDPTYADFAYLSFTIGMTYQVSDTPVTSRVIRATVARQALLSYVFGTSIIAVLINVVAGFVQK
jgi:uncharacterized membrane protein